MGGDYDDKERLEMHARADERQIAALEARSLEGLQAEVGEWGDRAFPSHYDRQGRANARGPVYHLADPVKGEARELLAAFHGKGDMAEEAADCLILLLTIAHLRGFSLAEAYRKKMAKNRLRRWGRADENGVVEHLKEGEE